MSNPIKFAAECESFNRRVSEIERILVALETERGNLLIVSRDSGVLVGHAKKMLAKVSHNIEFPDGFKPMPPDTTDYVEISSPGRLNGVPDKAAE